MFMDIIMPRLDGVSATMYIRQHCPSTPIIAMTSNIRPDEVNGYFEHGKLEVDGVDVESMRCRVVVRDRRSSC